MQLSQILREFENARLESPNTWQTKQLYIQAVFFFFNTSSIQEYTRPLNVLSSVCMCVCSHAQSATPTD